MTKTIPIFFSINDAYAPFLSVTVASIKAHSNLRQNYELIVLYEVLSVENRERLGNMATGNVAIRFVQLSPELLARLAGEHRKLPWANFTLSIYYRLFIAAMFPQYDQAIYLDADVVVTTDLAALFHMDLGDHLVGAVRETFAIEHSQSLRYVEHRLQLPIAQYFNSGVLLLNLRQMREEGFSENFSRLLTTYHPDFIAPDQDYLNELCRDRVLYLDPAWNAMPTRGKRIVPKVAHYTLFSKPWHYPEAQNAQYFWDIAPQSPYYAEILAIQRAFTAADRAQDCTAERNLLRTLAIYAEKQPANVWQIKKELELI